MLPLESLRTNADLARAITLADKSIKSCNADIEAIRAIVKKE